jgi:glycosidase
MKYIKRCAAILTLCTVFLSACGSTAPANTATATALATATAPATAAASATEAAESASWQDVIAKAASVPDGQTVSLDPAVNSWYEVFVYSFVDSNGDGIGDLKGLTSRLDYIKYLGFNGIWLMPIGTSPSYHKYDVADYYSVDPQYGTMDDFDAFMAQCDKLGIKVILDLVLNHTSSQNAWFTGAVDALKNGDTSNPYISYYNFEQRSPGGAWYTATDGWCYEAEFSQDMPDLNLSNDAVRGEIKNIMKFWLDKGVAGFRLDAVKDYVSGDGPANIQILSWISQTAKALKPDAYLVGENWDTSDAMYSYYGGIDSLFDFPFASSTGTIAKALLQNKGADADSFVQAMVHAQDEIAQYGSDTAADAPFFTNHDMARAAGFLRRDPQLIKTAWGMNLMMSGDAFVYYGEELGMGGSGKDENKRAPMYWSDAADTTELTSGPPNMDKQTNTFAPAAGQITDDSSILNYVRKAVRLRAQYPAIALGQTEALQTSVSPAVGAAAKTYNGQRVVLLYNLGAAAQTAEPVSGSWGNLADYLSATGEAPTQNGQSVSLAPYTIAILTDGATPG